MADRYLSIWFPHLITDWVSIRHPELGDQPFVFTIRDHGRIMITATSRVAEQQGAAAGMAVADAKAIVGGLKVFDEIPGKSARLLAAIGEWSIRYTPFVAVDLPAGLLLDISGCPHLWGGEQKYLDHIRAKLETNGYHIRAAIADTIGAAWAMARFGDPFSVLPPGGRLSSILSLPPTALRLEEDTLDKLRKVGFSRIEHLTRIPRPALRRRFGTGLLQRLDQVSGREKEIIIPIQPLSPYEERLPCLEPIVTAKGIAIALGKLLELLCRRLQQEGKGLRKAILRCYRIDGKMVQAEIGTNRASHNAGHLFRLFELRIPSIEPALGIELFVLQAPVVEEVIAGQTALWVTDEDKGLENAELAELLDRLAGKLGEKNTIRRYLPLEHHWPERSVKPSASLAEKPATAWGSGRPRPIRLLAIPEPVEVTAPIPDYPPMLFIHRNELHRIKKADGPERIEREWWIEAGELRDYYQVEDEEGRRYWLFRSGHYSGDKPVRWYLHGFFA